MRNNSRAFPAIFFILLVTISVTAIACGSKSSVTGRYASQDYPDMYLELKSEGNFVLSVADLESLEGKYSVKDNTVTLVTGEGDTEELMKLTIEGEALVDEYDSNWVKQ